MRDPKTLPVIAVDFAFPDGSHYKRSWTMATAGEAPEFIRPGAGPQMPPDWLEEAGRHWDHPQDPVTLTGRVKPGREAEARKALEAS